MTKPVLIALPWARPPLAQNDRLHWRAKAEAFKQAKTDAQWAIRAAKVERLSGAEVTLHYRVPDWKIRDTDGPAPTLKACLDALVAEKVIPADDWRRVPFSGVRFHPPDGLPGTLWLELIPVDVIPVSTRLPKRGAAAVFKDKP